MSAIEHQKWIRVFIKHSPGQGLVCYYFVGVCSSKKQEEVTD